MEKTYLIANTTKGIMKVKGIDVKLTMFDIIIIKKDGSEERFSRYNNDFIG